MKSKFPLFASLVLVGSVNSAFAALNAPSNVAAHTAGPATIVLSWDDNETSEANYIVQRDDSGWTTIATLPADTTHYYDRGLALGSSHNYRVQASNSGEVSAYVESGSATTLDYQPNILFYLADDMGYKDLVGLRNEAIDGPTIHETPALDSFIDSFALSIDNAYCSGPRCVVARRSIQTGKYDWRPEAVPNNDYYVDHTGSPTGGGLWAGGITIDGSKAGSGVPIPFDNETYGEALKSAGYRTAFIGKYHLGESPSDTPVPGYTFGDQPPRGPDMQGYDVSIAAGHAGAPPASYFSVENQHDLGNYTFELPDMDDANYGTAAPVEGEYLTDRMTDKAIGFMDDAITNHSSEPFALTLAHYAVHTPMEAKAADITYFKNKKASMTAEFAAHPAGASGLITDYSTKTRVWQDNAVYAAMMRSYDESFAELRAYLAATDDPRHPGKKLSETTIIVVSSDHGGKSTTPIEDNKSLEDDATDPVNPAPTYDAGSGAYKSGLPNAYSSYPTSNYPYRQGKTWVYEGGLKVPLLVYIPGMTVGGTRSNAFVHHADLFATFVDMAGGTQSSESTDSISFMLTAAQPEATARDEMHHFFTNANQGTGNPALGAYRKGDYKLLYFMVQRRIELYNLVADPYEQNDLSESRPDLAAEMLNEVYQQALSTGMSMPKPGSNTWDSEQKILLNNGVIGALPAVPDANPSWVDGGVTQLSDTTLELNWTVNASNATHSVVYRRADPDGETNFREYAYLPARTTTFRDTNLVAGGTYRYRVESENLGGWAAGNTGNNTTTLSDPGPGNLPMVALDDNVTIVPGGHRNFNPLLNDEGEGALTITAITQPSAGFATFDGQRIHYQAPESFSGSVTMTYTITDAASQSDTATVTIGLPIFESTSAIDRWDFDESAGMQLENTLSQNLVGFTGTTSSSVTTNGSGQLVLTADTTNHNRESGTLPGAPYTSGKYQLIYQVNAVDLTNSPDGTGFGFSFRDDTSNTDFGVIRLRKQSSSLLLEVRANSSNTQAYDFAALSVSDAKVMATLDLDASPKTISVEVSIGGASPVGLTSVEAEASVTVFDIIKFQGTLDSPLSPLSAEIEYVEVLEVNNEPSLYSVWASAYPWLGLLDRDGDDDADLDGMSNFLEFALGMPPGEANVSPVVVDINGVDPVIRFTPVRDTSVLDYEVQFSGDLGDWVTIPPVAVTSAAGVLVEEDLPAGVKGFGRVSVSE